MATPRPPFSSRYRKGVAIPQEHQARHPTTATAAAGFQTLPHHFPRAHRLNQEVDEMRRTGRGGTDGIPWGIVAHENPQRPLAPSTPRRQTSRPHFPQLPPSLISQCQGRRQASDFYGGSRLVRHDPVACSRLDRNLTKDGSDRHRQPVVMAREELHRGISREDFAEFRIRKARDEVYRDIEVADPFRSSLNDNSRDTIQISRSYHPFSTEQHMEKSSMFRDAKCGRGESAYTGLVPRYDAQSSWKELDRARAIIAQTGNLSRKRCRDEEEDFNTERVRRHRKLSGIDSPSGNRFQSLCEKEDKHRIKVDYRQLRLDEEEPEDGQVTTPPGMVSCKYDRSGIESKTQLLRHEADTVPLFRSDVNSRGVENLTRSQNVLAHPQHHGSPFRLRSKSGSRPSTGMESGKRFGAQFKLPGSPRDQIMTRRDRFPSPRIEDKERIVTKVDLVGGDDKSYSMRSDSSRKVDQEFSSFFFPPVEARRNENREIESYSVQRSDSVDMKRKMDMELESQSCPPSLTAAERGQDFLYSKKHCRQVDNTPPRNFKTSPSLTRNWMGGDCLDNYYLLSKDPRRRLENEYVRKTSTISSLKDGRHAKELTISLQKDGQRIVKVEDHRIRESNFRGSSQSINGQGFSHCGGSRLGNSSETPCIESDRLSLVKRKESKDRQASAVRDDDFGPESSKGGTNWRPVSTRYLIHGRNSPSSDIVEREIITQTGQYEIESQRQESIFSRLVGFNRGNTSVSLRPASEACNETNLVPSCSKNLPIVTVPISESSDNYRDKNVDLPVCPKDLEFPPDLVHLELMSIEGSGLVPDIPSSIPREPCDILSKDDLKGEELSRRQNITSGVKIIPQGTIKAGSPVERRPELLKTILTQVEYPLARKSDQVMDGTSLPFVESRIHSSAITSDAVSIEGQGPLQGTVFKPGVIATGHKKEQVCKMTCLNIDNAEHGVSSVVRVDAPPGERISEENCDRNTSTGSTEWMPSISGCTQNAAILNSCLTCGCVLPSADNGDLTPRSILGDKKQMGTESLVEIAPNLSLTRCTESALCESCSSIRKEPLISRMTVEDNQMNSSQVSEGVSVLQHHKKNGSLSMISQPSLDGVIENGSSISPVASSTSSKAREVLLFGANLNAPLCEQLEPIQVDLEYVGQKEDQNMVLTFDSQVTDYDQIPISMGRISTSSCPMQEPEKDVVLPEVLTYEKGVQPKDAVWQELSERDVQTAQLHDLAERPEASLIHQCLAAIPSSVECDLPIGQVQIEQPLVMVKEQSKPPPELLKNSAGCQVRHSSLRGVKAHTWHRGKIMKSTENSSLLNGTHPLDEMFLTVMRSKSTAYVRKGNSLVRAPGVISTAHPANAIKSMTQGMSVPARAAQRSLAVQPILFKKTFIANPVHSKPFYPAHRKYIAPSVETDEIIASASGTAKSSNLESGLSSTPPPGFPESSSLVPLKTSLMKSSPILKSNGEQQTAAVLSLDFPSADPLDNIILEASPCRPANYAPSATQTHYPTVTPSHPPSTVAVPASGSMLYVRRKANQLVVAPSQPTDLFPAEIQNSGAGQLVMEPGVYFKRKTNQLVRSNGGKKGSCQNFAQDVQENGVSLDVAIEQNVENTLAPKKMRVGRVLRQKKHCARPLSWVWTLSGAARGSVGDITTQSLRTEPLLFPWKRQNSLKTTARLQRPKLFPRGKKGSLLFLMSKRLRKVQPVQPVYTRSADGFSLHRSGVMSLGGGNLKWTKSLERQAKQVSEAATKAVAEAERRKRQRNEQVDQAEEKVKAEKRASRKAARGDGGQIVWVGLVRYKMDAASKTLQRIPEPQENGVIDQDCADITGDGDTTGSTKALPLLTPRRPVIGGTPYLRVGNGNQLVRDPKAASRALASEKVRWSLHNARSRGAKKPQYCQFFTKFGKCNKQDGRCSYIHDPDKVAVCTKFLKGNCIEAQCPLTHKVIPERMPDCSFFLEGLCTNESCPYRHISVNPKAPYCDGFLRGYCKDGDKCNKKHTYVCPVYAETGDCLDPSTCKFHHPKKKTSFCDPVQSCKITTKQKRRYFSTLEPDLVMRENSAPTQNRDKLEIDHVDPPHEGFISLSHIESDEDQKVTKESQTSWLASGFASKLTDGGFPGDLEKWIKPMFLLQRTAAATVAH